MEVIEDILVSVIMCVYNTPQEYLVEAVKSVLQQTYHNLELIIVDDYSSTDLYSGDLFKDSRIIILRNDKNYGPSYSRNRALNIAKGKYIAIMDSDDISLPTRIEKQLKYMESHPDVVALGTWFKQFGIKNNEVKRNLDDNEYYRCCLLFGNVPTLLNPSVMIRKDTLDKYNIRYDERLRYGEDYKMWYQLSKIGIVTNYKEILVHYRTHDKQATYNNGINRQSSSNDNIVKQEMLDELKLNLSEEKKDLFFNFIHSKEWNAVKYITILNKLIEANKVSRIYQEDKLEQRVHEQWVSTVQNVKNPFKMIPLLINQKCSRKKILKIKISQTLLSQCFWHIKNVLRRKTRIIRRQLFIFLHFRGIDKDITILSNNCLAGMLYRNMNAQYKSPTIWTLIPPDDFVKFINNLEYYLHKNIEECEPLVSESQKMYPLSKVDYPCGLLGGDIKILFPHQNTIVEAKEKWNERLKRINYKKIYVVLYGYMNYLNEDFIQQYNRIPYKKILLTANEKINGYNSFCLNLKRDEDWWVTIHQVKAKWEKYNWKKFFKT